MPIIQDQKAAQGHVNAWKTALPSQVIDSFYQTNHEANLIERIVAFEITQEDIKHLAAKADSNLELVYGFDSGNLGGEQSAFKMYLRNASKNSQDKNVYSPYYSLKSLTVSAIKKQYPPALRKSLFSHQVGTATANEVIDSNPETISNEFITPTIEQWLFYAWRSCQASHLIDKVETTINGNKCRIEKSKFDSTVSTMVRNLENENQGNQIYTFALLGLHQVIPGDPRRYHFGPILQSYVVPKSLEDSSGSEASQEVIRPVSFELTFPCPPCEG